jgi:membrane protease YdiL (CAAX protease family)
MQPQPNQPEDMPPLAVRIFMGPYGLRAGWRFLLFAFLALMLAMALSLGVKAVSRLTGPDAAALPGQFIGVTAALIAMWVMGRVEGKPVWSYGFAAPHGARNLAAGLVAGIAGLSVLMGLLTAAGAYKPGPPMLHGADVVRWGVYWAVVFAGVALGEESITRSYGLFSLSQGVGFWPAAAILSVLFGAVHLGNSGEEWIGIGNAMLAGLVLSYSVKWSGSLWWAIGYHMSWDWGESFFYGVADSGGKASHHLLSGDPAGAGWLSGGSVGPEGSVLAIPVLLALALAARLTTPRWDNPGLDRLRPVARPLAVDDAQDPGGVSVA